VPDEPKKANVEWLERRFYTAAVRAVRQNWDVRKGQAGVPSQAAPLAWADPSRSSPRLDAVPPPGVRAQIVNQIR